MSTIRIIMHIYVLALIFNLSASHVHLYCIVCFFFVHLFLLLYTRWILSQMPYSTWIMFILLWFTVIMQFSETLHVNASKETYFYFFVRCYNSIMLYHQPYLVNRGYLCVWNVVMVTVTGSFKGFVPQSSCSH